MTLPRARVLIVSLLVLAPSAAAEGVRIVSANGELVFSEIQPAVDAAADGDVLLVAEGSYSGFAIDGKALSLVALPGAVVDIAGGVAIRNLAAEQTALISGLNISGIAFADAGLLWLENNQGYVRVQDCSFVGGSIGWGPDCFAFDGGHGAAVRDCAGVAFLSCELIGTEGQWQDSYNGNCDAGKGGAGLYCERSNVALYDCELTGGQGGQAKYQPGEGGRGVDGTDSEVFASGGWVHGGPGGCTYFPFLCSFQDIGGEGAWLDATSTLTTLGSELLGGPGSPAGPTLAGNGAHVPLPAEARALSVATIAVDAAPLQVNYQGEENDELWLTYSTELNHVYRPALLGVELSLYSGSLQGPFGVAPATGLLAFAVPLALLAPTATHAELALQGLAGTPAGPHRLSGARHMLVLSPTVGPDCDGSGTSDFVDVLTGASPDENHNLIPDACELPITYCTAGTSASGCLVVLSATGTASASASSGFVLAAATVEGQKDGLFFFGTSGRQASPWGNGSSYQCVVPPVRRAGLLAGSGTSGSCDGSFVQDLNALWCPTCPKPLQNPGAGAIVDAQLWYRDPFNTSNQTTSLSDAVEFCVGP
jgi:hypothetical protein